MTNRFLAAGAMVVALMLLIGSTIMAAPRPAPKATVPADPARQAIVKIYQAGGTIAKVQVAFDARDWQLMRFYVVEEYAVSMRSVTAMVKDLSARRVDASPTFDTVQQGTLKHMATLKKLEAKAPSKEVKDVITFGIKESQSAHDAAAAAILKATGP